MIKFFTQQLILLIILLSCSNHLKRLSFKGFEASIYEIDASVGELTTPASLFNIDKFIFLSKNATSNFDHALTIVTNEKYSMQQKLICIFIMQNLKKEKYIEFIDKNIELFNEGKIEDYLLLQVIKPQIKQSFSDDKQYNQRVKKMVLQINNRANYFDKLIEEYQRQ